jgi:hypothetical protein
MPRRGRRGCRGKPPWIHHRTMGIHGCSVIRQLRVWFGLIIEIL